MNYFKTLIWDWNGTLLDDIHLCINSINKLLEKRGLETINTKKYREVFSFPVKDYYQNIGFDFSKEDFSIPAHEFIDLYNSNVHLCSLHKNSIKVLEHFKSKGIKQFVLSAMKQDMLEQTLNHQNIIQYFKAVQGLDDHYANSKIKQGENLIEKHQVDKKT